MSRILVANDDRTVHVELATSRDDDYAYYASGRCEGCDWTTPPGYDRDVASAVIDASAHLDRKHN